MLKIQRDFLGVLKKMGQYGVLSLELDPQIKFHGSCWRIEVCTTMTASPFIVAVRNCQCKKSSLLLYMLIELITVVNIRTEVLLACDALRAKEGDSKVLRNICSHAVS